MSIEKLTVALGNGASIVDEVSFAVAPGETFALLGESGCGKSMTALALMRLLPDGVTQSGGAVRFDNIELSALSEREMCGVRGGRIAMIFQEPGLSLNPVMTIGRQIAEVLELHARLQDTEARCIELLRQVGIPDPARRIGEYPFQLSGGMKQRVMIAMALAGNPGLLVADEPTTALDVTIQAQVLELLRELQRERGMAMLLITHDLGVVAQTAHRVGVMYAGQIVEQASRTELFEHPLHPYTRKLFAALPDMSRRGEALAAIPGNVPPLGSAERGCRFASRCDQVWDRCRDDTPEWTALENGRGVRCHLFSETGNAKRETQTPHPLAGQAANCPQAGLVDCLAVPSAGAGEGGVSRFPLEVASLLQVSDLRVHFPIRKGLLQRTVGQVKAVDGVSLKIAAGRTLALVGESGCGKTTLGKALLQLVRPSGGSVQLEGGELVGLDARALRGRRAAMQMVFQDPHASLNPKMRIAEILQEGMEALQIGGSGAARQERIDALLDRVGLDAVSKWRYPHEFSGGQRQRIAIARALAVAPKLLVCDEPTSALDVSVQAQILNLMKSLQQELGLGYLFITHNLAVVEYLAHEVCVMYLGRIVERGTAEEVLRAPAHPYTRALLSAVPRLDAAGAARIRLEGELPSPAHPPAGCHFAPRCPLVEARCRAAWPEEVRLSPTHAASCLRAGE